MQHKYRGMSVACGVLVFLMTVMLSGPAHAVAVTRMTIEEIGASGVGTSASSSGAGYFSLVPVPGDCSFGCRFFNSIGSPDGAIIMGVPQGNGAFVTNFEPTTGYPGYVNTQGGATVPPTGPVGDISASGVFTLSLSGWGMYADIFSPVYQLPQFPDAGTLTTSVQQISANQWYYTADWTHIITTAEYIDLSGNTATWHLEGIVTTVPLPAAIWLLGAGLFGLLGVAGRRSR